MFSKVSTDAGFVRGEHDVLRFWREHRIFEQLRLQNQGKPHWSFIDGPITANNPMGVHHAWGRTYKDAFQRFFAMTGHALRYQNGFDCQGLWVEVEVEKQLGLKSKRDIETLKGHTVFDVDRTDVLYGRLALGFEMAHPFLERVQRRMVIAAFARELRLLVQRRDSQLPGSLFGLAQR